MGLTVVSAPARVKLRDRTVHDTDERSRRPVAKRGAVSGPVGGDSYGVRKVSRTAEP
ncbi:hypothetical protein GCM10022199_14690 [Marihabitans asiaticum]